MKIKLITLLTIATVVFAAACGKSDSDLQTAVQQKLTTDGIMGVTVAVNDGVATLTGQVDDVTVRNRAETSARSVEGIKSVTNNVTTKPLATPTPPPADPALQGKIETNLKQKGCTGLTVTTTGGRVTVSGTVPSAKYAECVQVVQESGAAGFTNQITRGN